MERLGGFLLCRRLLPERLPPFLSLEDISGGRRAAGCEGGSGESAIWGGTHGHAPRPLLPTTQGERSVLEMWAEH